MLIFPNNIMQQKNKGMKTQSTHTIIVRIFWSMTPEKPNCENRSSAWYFVYYQQRGKFRNLQQQGKKPLSQAKFLPTVTPQPTRLLPSPRPGCWVCRMACTTLLYGPGRAEDGWLLAGFASLSEIGPYDLPSCCWTLPLLLICSLFCWSSPSPSWLVHNESQKPFLVLGKSTWSHQTSQGLRLNLNGGPRLTALRL
jgi:hypothetical protein